MTMMAIELKGMLHNLIDREKDNGLLEQVRELLTREKAWQAVLTERVRKSEAEYAAGLGEDLDDVAKELDEEFGA